MTAPGRLAERPRPRRQALIKRVCVVANGPTAEGKGDIIDECDFVIRIKEWWLHAAANVGKRCDATAWYGYRDWVETRPEGLQCEHWITRTAAWLTAQGPGGPKRIADTAGNDLVHWLPGEVFRAVGDYICRFPSTGFTTIAMVMHRFCPAELVLCGFDSCGPARPNYHDARRQLKQSEIDNPPHNHLREKRVVAELRAGIWLGEPVSTQLIWVDPPEIGGPD